MSGALQVTSSADAGASGEGVTAGAASCGGGSSRSVTRIVTAALASALGSAFPSASSPSLTLTVTVCAGAASWSSAAPAATRISPVAASMVKRSEPEIA